MAPWQEGKRHESWASDTVVTGIALLILLATTVTVDALNGPADPPTYLTGLLGLSGGAFFGAAGRDKQKREKEIANDAAIAKSRMIDVNETAIDAQHTAKEANKKADRLTEIAKREHPEITSELPPMLKPGEDE